jgi:two-component system sensor histidine kinase KdpD
MLKKELIQCFYMTVLLATITVINYRFFSALGMTGITLLYLLMVVAAAYFYTFFIAFSTAFAAFFAINYFFVAPHYTFQVEHIESWASLISFLVVSLVITSLVKQLRSQTKQSLIASKRAQFARTLAENLALAKDIDTMLHDTCRLLKAEFNKPFFIAKLDANNTYTITLPPDNLKLPDPSALEWVANNGNPIGPYTGNWTESLYWLMPFNRLPSQHPILVVYDINAADDIEMYIAIKTCVDQVSMAYQRLIHSERARLAELMAQEEAIQSALLASIAHDMRTPLTSILGAATTLQQKDVNLDANQTAHLTALIASQAQYLASTTENILSLMRLESSPVKGISMDLQSPEEIIGIVTALYKNRGDSVHLLATISEPDLLIKANANLLTQALVNLIDNAKQANLAVSKQTEEAIQIDVTKTENLINISVQDRGIGFGETFNATQIKKFSSGHAKGFGLGLSIVQAIAKAHDATLTISNRDGGGACVTLSFHAPDVDISHV